MDLALCPVAPGDVVDSPRVTVTADGRRVKTVDGVPWGAGSLSNGVHRGASLSDILQDLLVPENIQRENKKHNFDVIDGIDLESIYVELEGADIAPEETLLKSTLGYAAGLPLTYVLDPANQVLLSYAMNGEDLTPAHGAPLRAVAPGQIGARSVKWLVKVTLLAQPSSSYFMQQDYKHFPPNVLPKYAECERGAYCQLSDAVYAAGVPFTSLNVQLAVTKPASATTNIVGSDGPVGIAAGAPLEVEGFAFSGGGAAAQAVYLCLLPEGEPLSWCDAWGWTAALLTPAAVPVRLPTGTPTASNWAWTFWKATLPLDGGVVRAGAYRVVARAVDTGNQHMPENICPIYSWRGVLNNAWFKLPVIAHEKKGALEEKHLLDLDEASRPHRY
jgi:sulfite oxidase